MKALVKLVNSNTEHVLMTSAAQHNTDVHAASATAALHVILIVFGMAVQTQGVQDFSQRWHRQTSLYRCQPRRARKRFAAFY